MEHVTRADQLIREISEVLDKDHVDVWFQEIQRRIVHCSEYWSLALNAKALAHTYCHKNDRLTCGFALTSALAALFAQRLPSALEIYAWIREEYPNHYVTTKLHSLLASQIPDERHNSEVLSADPKALPLFLGLAPELLDKVLRIPKYRKISAQTKIFGVGDAPEKFYLITSGEVEVVDPDGHVNLIREGDYFGEVSLLLNHAIHSRGASARTDVEVLEFSKGDLSEFFQQSPQSQDQIIQTLFARCFFNLAHQLKGLDGYSHDDLLEIFQGFEVRGYQADKVLFDEGEDAKSLYFVIEGHVRIFKGHTVIGQVGPGQFVGEMAILEGRKHDAKAVIINKCFCLVAHQKELLEIIQKYPRFGHCLRMISQSRKSH